MIYCIIIEYVYEQLLSRPNRHSECDNNIFFKNLLLIGINMFGIKLLKLDNVSYFLLILKNF